MERRITPLRDLVSLVRIIRILRRLRPAIVHAHTPKGALLGLLASWIAHVPTRIYHVHGSPLLTATGNRALLLRASERVSCALAHRVLAVSHSVRAFMVAERLCAPDKVKVLAAGSLNGVDTRRFAPASERERREERARLGIPQDALVVGFLGRLAREKGIAELARAFEELRADERVHLLVVGDVDGIGDAPAPVLARLAADPRVHLAGRVTDSRPLYAAMDVVALPTYREGFTTVGLETAAMGLPIVASGVTGCVDAVLDGATGTLVPPRDVGALARALREYLDDPALRARHGKAARQRVIRDFRREPIWEALAAEYGTLSRP